jgi:hypothetical protein
VIRGCLPCSVACGSVKLFLSQLVMESPFFGAMFAVLVVVLGSMWSCFVPLCLFCRALASPCFESEWGLGWSGCACYWLTLELCTRYFFDAS